MTKIIKLSDRWLALAIIVTLAITPTACNRSQPPNTEGEKKPAQQSAHYFRQQFDYFSTVIDVQLDQTDQQTADTAFAKLETLFAQWHRDWDAWGDGALGQINQTLQSGNTVTIPNDLLPLFHRARDISNKSLGYFGPETGAVVQLWGFDDSERTLSAPPDTSAVIQLMDRTPRFADMAWDDDCLVVNDKDNVTIQLDFGGFIKGAAVDAAIEQLRQLDINNAIVNTGGDLRAMGQRHDRPWRVGIKHPRANTIFASVAIHHDETVFTSGDYERFFEADGRRYHHILDPHNGWPSQGLVSATVLGKQGAYSDAAATALMAAGKARWQEVADSMKLHLVMVIDDQGTVYLTKAMQARLQFESPDHTIEIIN
ncbi:MAG: FAD:protein FMN transferase [Gammaproteobacteria bacterium]|nr:FAD:protein FMN transferase [Gammaproteobacteria bacterium]